MSDEINDGFNLLTNDAKYLLLNLYKEYIGRRNHGMIKVNARDFGSSDNIQESLMPEWNQDDVADTILELSRMNFVKTVSASNFVHDARLTTIAIARMEHRYQDKVNNVVEAIAKVKSLIPFI
ncbi:MULTISPECIES: hypothetical protein [Lactobacillaceae]|uniref:hypothetical protein n=1 Tax=Lactobacillaceae TaxID=33958 RepID=UPI001456434B|nr:hypothetical protein [Lactobacillus sp. HBUAS51381]NLR08697.1 hypothetical protein [Lactobacillus sp. HBUAS51381]